MMKDTIATGLIVTGLIVMLGTVGRADYAVATRTFYSDLRLLFGLLVGSGMTIFGMWLKGWVE